MAGQKPKCTDLTHIAQRNEQIRQAATISILRARSGVAIWMYGSYLLRAGAYRNPIPPDPLDQILPDEMGVFLGIEISRLGLGRFSFPHD